MLFRPLPAPVVDVVRSAQGLLVEARLAFFFLAKVAVDLHAHAWLFAVPLASSFRLLLATVLATVKVKVGAVAVALVLVHPLRLLTPSSKGR